jgi:hypothetical protein
LVTSINRRDAKHLGWVASVRFDLIVCYSMGMYKGVRALDDFHDVDFLVWKPLALGFFEQHDPNTAELLLKHADDLENDTVRGFKNDPAVQRAARAAAARHDELAKGHIMLLLGPTMQSQRCICLGEGSCGMNSKNLSGYGRIARDQCGNGNGARLGRCH